ncbi:hypothetical protein [Cytobacillus gottheilii]|nr:hypothetical protein [Cytobacillus gottheilii]
MQLNLWLQLSGLLTLAYSLTITVKCGLWGAIDGWNGWHKLLGV